ncbi:CLUMA_CG015624, isoform A [Clunio marinus]|uniref:CLUMA_CG015624, isoform A n=1 Tax=Clunio marinus TaxID=568069 RepID=A0A1J1IST1_9DIPT|nr:CLUMA_CG015624, isoform A [Clunio marinus]
MIRKQKYQELWSRYFWSIVDDLFNGLCGYDDQVSIDRQSDENNLKSVKRKRISTTIMKHYMTDHLSFVDAFPIIMCEMKHQRYRKQQEINRSLPYIRVDKYWVLVLGFCV